MTEERKIVWALVSLALANIVVWGIFFHIVYGLYERGGLT